MMFNQDLKIILKKFTEPNRSGAESCSFCTPPQNTVLGEDKCCICNEAMTFLPLPVLT